MSPLFVQIDARRLQYFPVVIITVCPKFYSIPTIEGSINFDQFALFVAKLLQHRSLESHWVTNAHDTSVESAEDVSTWATGTVSYAPALFARSEYITWLPYYRSRGPSGYTASLSVGHFVDP